MFIYIVLVIFFIFLTFLTAHYLNYTKINTGDGIDIHQSEHPGPDVIDKMLATKLPCIFMHEIELWDGFDLLIGYPYDAISAVVTDNKQDLIKILKKEYLCAFSLPLSRGWTVAINNLSLTWDGLTTKPTLETNYNHFIANFSGLMMVCFIHPNHSKFIKRYSADKTELSFAKYLESNSDTPINYLTIPIRPSHLLYIPYGWYYYIYCGQNDSNIVFMDLVNNTWF